MKTSQLLLLAVLATGCRGGGVPLQDIDADVVNQPDAAVDGSDAGVDGDPCATPQAPPVLGCPEVDLPFETQTSSFENEQSAEDQAYHTHSVQDAMLNPGGEVTLSAKMSRGERTASVGFDSEAASMWIWNGAGSWTEATRGTTSAEGQITFDLDDLGLEPGSHRVHAVLEGDGSCAQAGAFIWPAGTKVILTDIDGTLTTDDQELILQIGNRSHDPARNGSAIDLMQTWQAKGYKAVYLTARPHIFRLPTREWLDRHGFPFGPIITADGLVFGDSARAYKTAAIERLLDTLGWDIVKVYGNAGSDIDAYENAGINKADTYIIGENAGASGTQAVADQDYAAHIASVVDSFPDANQPFEAKPYCVAPTEE